MVRYSSQHSSYKRRRGCASLQRARSDSCESDHVRSIARYFPRPAPRGSLHRSRSGWVSFPYRPGFAHRRRTRKCELCRRPAPSHTAATEPSDRRNPVLLMCDDDYTCSTADRAALASPSRQQVVDAPERLGRSQLSDDNFASFAQLAARRPANRHYDSLRCTASASRQSQ